MRTAIATMTATNSTSIFSRTAECFCAGSTPWIFRSNSSAWTRPPWPCPLSQRLLQFAQLRFDLRLLAGGQQVAVDPQPFLAAAKNLAGILQCLAIFPIDHRWFPYPAFKTEMNASCGMFTLPMAFMRFLPSFCFSHSLRLRVMSPP